MRQIDNFINGEFVASSVGRRFEKRSPVDNRVIASIAEAGQPEVDQAVTAAKRALTGEWGKLATNERVDLLYQVADEITRRFDDFVDAEMADTGQPEHVMKHAFIPRGAANLSLIHI